MNNKFLLLQVDYKGKYLKSLQGIRSLLNLWALQNTNGKKKTYIADETGKVVRIYQGTGTGFPLIIKEKECEELGLQLENNQKE